MPEIDNDHIGVEVAHRRPDGPKTITNLEPIRAAQSRDHSQSWAIGGGKSLRVEHTRGHRPISETVGEAAVIETQIQQISDRSAFHVAVDEYDGSLRRQRPRETSGPRSRSLSGAGGAYTKKEGHGALAPPES